MTALDQPSTGASSTNATSWKAIHWPTVEGKVKRLQMRIAKAIREKRFGKAMALQWILTHSHSAKLLAVKRVVQNKGGKTSGVDGVVWSTDKQKMQGVKSLFRRGYKAQPLRRVYIPKSNGERRPLGIPTMRCRAMQALHLLGLEPVSETLADQNAYGFRPRRSTADAIAQCFTVLARRDAAQWILEGDIKACFDKINHDWLRANIITDKVVLNRWLKAGYIEMGRLHPTDKGTPQGGIISPTLLTMTLRGLEEMVKKSSPRSDKVHIVTYADDFIVTASSREILEQKVKPAIANFLAKRGLELSVAKTAITHIDSGFDFLGFNVRKYKGKLLIKPARKKVVNFLSGIRNLVKSNKSAKTENLIGLLNPKIRGWANYYRHVVAKETFSYVDHCIFKIIWQWAKRRHPNKERRWVMRKYYRSRGLRKWVFFAAVSNKKRNEPSLDLFLAVDVKIQRHVKIKGQAHPFDPAYLEYFAKRQRTECPDQGSGLKMA